MAVLVIGHDRRIPVANLIHLLHNHFPPSSLAWDPSGHLLLEVQQEQDARRIRTFLEREIGAGEYPPLEFTRGERAWALWESLGRSPQGETEQPSRSNEDNRKIETPPPQIHRRRARARARSENRRASRTPSQNRPRPDTKSTRGEITIREDDLGKRLICRVPENPVQKQLNELYQHFSEFGELLGIQIIQKGQAFLKYTTTNAVSEALQKADARYQTREARARISPSGPKGPARRCGSCARTILPWDFQDHLNICPPDKLKTRVTFRDLVQEDAPQPMKITSIIRKPTIQERLGPKVTRQTQQEAREERWAAIDQLAYEDAPTPGTSKDALTLREKQKRS